ncbi:Serine/threonine-protein kinase TOR, partial [Striga hermonthica]
MALVTTAQSIRYMTAGPPAGAGDLDALNRVLADLCSRGIPKDGAALALRRHVEEGARDLSGEAFSRFMDQLYDRITSLLESNDVSENLGALRAIDELIDVAIEENAVNVSKIATYMRTAFEAKREPETLVVASKVLGHLARAGGAMTADEVERLVKIALDWLGGDRIEYRRLAAVLILKEMAENASTVFNVHVPEFVEAIWVALRDPKLNIRERAVEALRACLWVIEKRETRWRVQWYYRMFEATQDGLGRNAPIHCIHGSLLAVGELLRNTGEFMMSRYREVAEIVLRYLEHRDRLVRLSITSLLPRIAYFLRDRFVMNYLTICMKHIFHVLKIPAEAASGFIALGEMAGALDGELINYLPTITSHLRDAIAPRRGQPSMEALACVGNLAKAMGPSMEPHVRNLLDVMFSVGLSSTLVEALEHITASIPTLLPTIQVRLLDCISGVFARNQQVQSRPSNGISRTTSSAAMFQVSELCGSALVQLALQTLARFNFKVAAFFTLRFFFFLVLCGCVFIVEKLLIAAVADADAAVRLSIFSSLHETGGFDDYLAQADCLTAVFAALNDEDFAVREIAISQAGRLSAKNPAYVLPALRRHLIQLLTHLKQSADNKCREESAKLLGCLIRNCERLILPYISPIQKALITKLNEGTGVSVNNGIITGVLVTVGDLTRVGGFAMRQYIPELMPLIVEALLDSAAAMKREVAVTTLGQVVQSTGYVITPYNEYPQLLGLLLKLLNGELAWSTRREVLKVLGIMGALDPHVHKRNQLTLPGSHGEVARAACDSSQHTRSSMDEVPVDLWPSFATSEDYYSTVAINCLMRIFRDSSLSSYHQKVVGSLIFIFKAMNLGCVPYLPKVLPELLHTVRSCDDNNLKEYITWKLGTLISIVRQHIRKYLPDLFSLISELWSSFSLPAANRPVHGSPVLHLLEQLCLAFNDEFRTHLPFVLPSCIQVLTDAERFKDYTYVVDILHTLEVFGGTLDDHMHLLLPALVPIFKLDASIEVRRAAIRTLTKLIPRVQVSCHISALVHHLKLVLDGKNDELRKDAVDALCCLGHALGEDFTIFIPSIHKLLSKHCMRHKDFEEIEDRIRRRDPLILVTVAQEQTCPFPGEVISDPLNDTEDPESRVDPHKPHKVNEGRIRSAGEAAQRSTREDWAEWMRHFSIELLKESPAPALRTCAKLAQLQPFVGRELFAVGFVSCWTELNEPCRRQLVRSLEMAFSSPNIPPEILATLLNLAEFMEHDERPLPIDIRLLGALAEKCRAFAKALHYKEMEFEGACSNMMDGNPVAVVEALIHINNQLHQHEAAVGILTYSQQHLSVQLKESWYEKLQRWDDALKAYTVKASQVSSRHLILEATLGQMRCLAALARWEELNNLCKEYWAPAEPAARLEMAPMAASAAWNMGEWDQMAEYVCRLDDGDENKLGVLGNTAVTVDGSSIGTFFRAVLLVRRGKYDEAREYVERARKCLCTEVAALVLESYERAYSNMVRVQQLSELEEVIDYCTLPAENPVSEGRRALIRNMWRERIRGAKRKVE